MKSPESFILRPFLNLLLPPRCPLCKRHVSEEEAFPFCVSCAEKIVETQGPCCPTCGRPLPSPDLLEDNPGFRCGTCREDPPSLDGTHVLARFSGPVREGIHLFKYSGHWRLGRDLMRRFRSRVQELLAETDMVIPVPLHPRRLRMRGFNQSVVLAREIAKMGGVPMILDAVVRTRKTSPQVGLQGKERLRNVRGSFAVTGRKKVESRKIVLVDDVVTTGATANACAHVLKKTGAASVHLIALAGAFHGPGDPAF